MSRFTTSRTINAPLDRIFETISDINNYSKAVPHVTKAEILSEVQAGVGTRFRETRVMDGKETTTELEVTEYAKNDCIRMVADSHGTVWDSLFTVKSVEGKTELTLTMDAKSHTLAAKLMTKVIGGMIQKGLEKDMDCLKAYCEE